MLNILNYFSTSEEQYVAFPLYPICYHMTVLDAEESSISAVNTTQSFCIYICQIFLPLVCMFCLTLVSQNEVRGAIFLGEAHEESMY